jgi:hypothetical protein
MTDNPYLADCRCLACEDARQLAAMLAAAQERLKGTVLIAASDGVRAPFRLEGSNPEYRLEIARDINDMMQSLSRAADEEKATEAENKGMKKSSKLDFVQNRPTLWADFGQSRAARTIKRCWY